MFPLRTTRESLSTTIVLLVPHWFTSYNVRGLRRSIPLRNERNFNRTGSLLHIPILTFSIDNKPKVMRFQLNCIAYMHLCLYYAFAPAIHAVNECTLWTGVLEH